ncbi:pyridoxamine 5'-phosphate oxidase family protein [Arhodomonas sp. AD133]|uniref:pyridoxamine 5'-phosphate oxidase family protein n=1 Tax=Arhodomonas sp. AD133 TaxID=3415009 RepID=UPI003EBF4603
MSETREAAHAVLDEALVAHVAFALGDRPVCLPMVYARADNALWLHAARGGRFFRALAGGLPVTVAVTLLDGLVLAKSGLKHSVNFRSVVVTGTSRAEEDGHVKADMLDRIVDHVMPGRSADCRAANRKELASTGVIAVSMDEVSFKRRSGPPKDLEGDRGLPHWAGVVPLHQVVGEAVPAPYGAAASLPPYLATDPQRTASTQGRS